MTAPTRSIFQLNDLGRLIFLDRYSRKEQDRSTVTVGREVVVCTDPSVNTQRELAKVTEVLGDRVNVTISKDGTQIEVPLDQIDIPTENFQNAHERISTAVASAESIPTEYAEQFYQELSDGRLVPAGRIWAGAGVEEKLTPYNCYVLPPPKDSRRGIIQTLDRMTEIMSRGGGVGIPLMSLRPKFALVRGVNGRSSGSVEWAELYSFATGRIEQGGSRRGALMLIQYVWHPDILEFVTAKKDQGRLNNANISVGVTDAFMEAVADDADWALIFPETSHPAYDTEWDGDMESWKFKGYPIKVFKTMKARALWDMIVEAAWASAEPGLFFVDRYNRMSNSYYYPEGRIWCTNPCGEQGIPGWSVCNLGHLNLSRYLIGDGMGTDPARIDWTLLGQSVRRAVRFMDDVIDIAFAPFSENAAQQQLERRIGLGTMGLGEAMIRCHVRYGKNVECEEFLNKLYGFITEEAYLASADLAEEKGSFQAFDAEKLLKSGFILTLSERVQHAIRTKGLRNVTILTQAPTGTVGTMVGTSTGIEPFIWWEWERKGRLGTHREQAAIYKEFLKANPWIADERAKLTKTEQFTTSKFLPNWFVTTAELSPEDHAYTQAWIQRWVDSSISKTGNLPADYTKEQVGEYYQLIHRLGCKGGTVYRDQSRSEQVLNVPKEDAPEAVVARPEMLPIPSGVYDQKAVSVASPVGKLHAKLGIHPDTKLPFEVWIDISKAGTSLTADAHALARLMSLMLRIDSPIPADRRLELIISQLSGIGGGDSSGFGVNRVLSVPDSISKALQKVLDHVRDQAAVPSLPEEKPVEIQKEEPKEEKKPKVRSKKKLLDLCPSCHGMTLLKTEGCSTCQTCGYSKC